MCVRARVCVCESMCVRVRVCVSPCVCKYVCGRITREGGGGLRGRGGGGAWGRALSGRGYHYSRSVGELLTKRERPFQSVIIRLTNEESTDETVLIHFTEPYMWSRLVGLNLF